MKKFDRLPPEKRKEEIKAAALALFNEKGFTATTMENIVQNVSLSKGGVYRIYPSTASILGDLMIDGMHLRNAYYEKRISESCLSGGQADLAFVLDMIFESLLIYPEFSSVYVEFLWEKRRNAGLEELYREVCAKSVSDTMALINSSRLQGVLKTDMLPLELITDIMNTVILGIDVLNLRDSFKEKKSLFIAAAMDIINNYLAREGD